ncbi:MAG TPA: hypothetical protein VFH56_13360 [Acidimicrobiales bacterium]|nr:hypothetical protein [Acidimicrobiales bacterium]
MRGAARIRNVLRRLRPRPPHVASSQSNEAEILARLVEQVDAPRSFLEFGFSPSELNCASLLHTCRGLLVDGDRANVEAARRVMPRKVKSTQLFLDLYNLHTLGDRYRPGELGVLSIDVDGNDYWFLEALLPRLQPAIVAVEYNASFGLRPITVPYDPRFDRHEKHPSGWYEGSSLEALTRLCTRRGYALVAISVGGINAFYVRGDLDKPPTLDAAEAYRECDLRNQWSGTTAVDQWEAIKDLPYVTVE